MVEGPGPHICLHTTLEGPWPQYVILEVSRSGLWTCSFGLSQFHGHGSWLVCEVALKLLAQFLRTKFTYWSRISPSNIMYPQHYIHNNVLWDRQYSSEYSHIQTEHEKSLEILCGILSIPLNIVMDLNNDMWINWMGHKKKRVNYKPREDTYHQYAWMDGGWARTWQFPLHCEIMKGIVSIW